MPKATHELSAPGVTDPLGTRISVYGKKDLKTRTDKAKELGVPVTVRKLKRGER